MKLSDILSEEEYASPTDAIDHMAADNQDENREVGDDARDIAHKDKAKILKIGRGNNHKTQNQLRAWQRQRREKLMQKVQTLHTKVIWAVTHLTTLDW